MEPAPVGHLSTSRCVDGGADLRRLPGPGPLRGLEAAVKLARSPRWESAHLLAKFLLALKLSAFEQFSVNF